MPSKTKKLLRSGSESDTSPKDGPGLVPPLPRRYYFTASTVIAIGNCYGACILRSIRDALVRNEALKP